MNSKTELKEVGEPNSKKPKLMESTETKEEKSDDKENSMNDDVELDSKISFPVELDASDILDGIEFDENKYYPSVTDRYFTPFYQLDVTKPYDDICLRVHSNHICMVSLAPSHAIFAENKTIENIDFKVSEKLDRLKNKVSGKAKHGAHPLQKNSNLCMIKCTDGSLFSVKCCMIGKLIEVNETLIENPDLLRKPPHLGGFIAIILPNLKHLDKIKEEMLTQEQYEKTLLERSDGSKKV